MVSFGKILINRKRLRTKIPLADRTIYEMEQRGDFPRRITLSTRCVAWDLSEVEEWIESRRSSGEQALRPTAKKS
jgi:prophage regulatory protein